MSIAVSRLDLLRHVSDHRSTICSNRRCKSKPYDYTRVPNTVAIFDNNVRMRYPPQFSTPQNRILSIDYAPIFLLLPEHPPLFFFFSLLSNDERTLSLGEVRERSFPLFRSYDGEITSDDRDCCRVKSTFLTILLLFRNVYGVSFERVSTRRIYIDVFPCLETQR